MKTFVDDKVTSGVVCTTMEAQISDIGNGNTVSKIKINLTCTLGTCVEFLITNNGIVIIKCLDNVNTNITSAEERREQKAYQRKLLTTLYEGWVINANATRSNHRNGFNLWMKVTLYANCNVTSKPNNNVIELKRIPIDLRNTIDREYIELIMKLFFLINDIDI